MMKYLFNPRSVAIIGASQNKHKIGYRVLENALSRSFPGRVFPVNPRGGEILGLPVLKSISEIQGEIDLAAVVIPAEYVFDSVKELADRGTKFCIIITSGFSEVGKIEEERRIVKYARSRGMRIIGPNVFGIYTAAADLNFTFGPKNITPGTVAIITQSGALGVAMLGKTAVEKIGLSSIVSVGNKSDIDEADIIENLVEDENTRLIFMYIEGVRDGERLVRTLMRATRKKPVIVIKSGRSARGAVAAASHTGSLAGADAVFDAIMRQCGVLRAESVRDAFN